MKREAKLQRRLQTLRTLGDAVAAMKSLAAQHYRGARDAARPARRYRDDIERLAARAGVSRAGASNAPAPCGLLLVAADLALDGEYSAHMTQAAIEQRRTSTAGPLYCVGRRARSRLERAGLHADRLYPAPSSVSGLPPLLLRLAHDILEDATAQRLGRLAVVSAHCAGVGQFTDRVTTVLPLWTTAHPATSPYVTADHVEAVALRELLYVTLFELFLDAMAAEHGARLVAAQAAERWIDDSIAGVRRELATGRRERATQEVLEISAGARCLRGGGATG